MPYFVVLGGPLKYLKHRAMLVLNAPNEGVLRKRLAEDPWMRTGVLRTLEIYPWKVRLNRRAPYAGHNGFWNTPFFERSRIENPCYDWFTSILETNRSALHSDRRYP